MNRHKLTFVVMPTLLGLGAISGVARVQSTLAQYRNAAPCYQLSGLAGLLQAAHFIPQGGCTVDLKKGGCHDRRACTITNPPTRGDDDDKNKGNCTPVNQGTDCACVARHED